MQQLPLIAPLIAPLVPKVPGLTYQPDYLTADEEHELMVAIDGEPWQTDWQRRRQVYGLSYGAAARPFPEWLTRFAERIVRDGWLPNEIANAVINEYEPGQGIGAHRDYAAFGPTVVAVSLGSACILELQKPPEKTKHRLDVQPRSLWSLGGEARKEWLHGIAARHADVLDGVKRPRSRRLSVTFRTSAASR